MWPFAVGHDLSARAIVVTKAMSACGIVDRPKKLAPYREYAIKRAMRKSSPYPSLAGTTRHP